MTKISTNLFHSFAQLLEDIPHENIQSNVEIEVSNAAFHKNIV